jgi:hypothetical protein
MASSEYLQREEAAKKQLGKKGVAKRAKQLPRAARATARGLLREVTGIDVSRKGVSVSPESLAMALPIGKVVKAARALRAAGKVAQANALEARLVTKNLGKLSGREIARTGSAYPADMVGYLKSAMAAKETASSVFPRLTMAERFTPPATGRVLKEQIKRKNAAAPRVTELEKRLIFPKRGR